MGCRCRPPWRRMAPPHQFATIRTIPGEISKDIADIAIMACGSLARRSPRAIRKTFLHKVNLISDAPPEWEAEFFSSRGTEADDLLQARRIPGQAGAVRSFRVRHHAHAVDGGEPDHYMALQASQDALKDCGPLNLEAVAAHRRNRRPRGIGVIAASAYLALPRLCGRSIRERRPQRGEVHLISVRRQVKAQYTRRWRS
jgi:hypothetical protein